MKKKIYAVIGGDLRNIHLIKMLQSDGHVVKNFGFEDYQDNAINSGNNLSDCIKDADIVIGPTPFSRDAQTLETPYGKDKILIPDFINLLKPRQLVIGGHITPPIKEIFQQNGVSFFDMLKREEMSLLNAIPTAEGAIQIAIDNTDFTINGSNIMVIGYGRIGTVLTKMLKGIGAEIFAVVNSYTAKSQARCYGYNSIIYEDMNDMLPQMDIIFNTVPSAILDKRNFKYLKKECLIVDLSSPPYGVDYDASKEYENKVIWTGSLPGRVAPKTTAYYCKDTIEHIIKEWEDKNEIKG